MKQYLRANIKLGFKLSVLRRIRFHHTGLKLAKNPKLFHFAFQIENIREKKFFDNLEASHSLCYFFLITE